MRDLSQEDIEEKIERLERILHLVCGIMEHEIKQCDNCEAVIEIADFYDSTR